MMDTRNGSPGAVECATMHEPAPIVIYFVKRRIEDPVSVRESRTIFS